MTHNENPRIAHEFLNEIADPKFIEAVKREEVNGYTWMRDPYHEGVIGLVKDGDPQEAIVIIYLYDEDFESSIDWS